MQWKKKLVPFCPLFWIFWCPFERANPRTGTVYIHRGFITLTFIVLLTYVCHQPTRSELVMFLQLRCPLRMGFSPFLRPCHTLVSCCYVECENLRSPTKIIKLAQNYTPDSRNLTDIPQSLFLAAAAAATAVQFVPRSPRAVFVRPSLLPPFFSLPLNPSPSSFFSPICIAAAFLPPLFLPCLYPRSPKPPSLKVPASVPHPGVGSPSL